MTDLKRGLLTKKKDLFIMKTRTFSWKARKIIMKIRDLSAHEKRNKTYLLMKRKKKNRPLLIKNQENSFLKTNKNLLTKKQEPSRKKKKRNKGTFLINKQETFSHENEGRSTTFSSKNGKKSKKRNKKAEKDLLPISRDDFFPHEPPPPRPEQTC